MNIQNLYKRLYISQEDFRMACNFSDFILKKGWHYNPWERRGTIYLQQSAFTTSLIIFYSRPFTRSAGLPDLPKHLVNYDKIENQLHEKIINLRHKVYAHSDDSSYKVDPIIIKGEAHTILGAPFFKLKALEVVILQKMINKVLIRIDIELKNLIPRLENYNKNGT